MVGGTPRRPPEGALWGASAGAPGAGRTGAGAPPPPPPLPVAAADMGFVVIVLMFVGEVMRDSAVTLGAAWVSGGSTEMGT